MFLFDTAQRKMGDLRGNIPIWTFKTEEEKKTCWLQSNSNTHHIPETKH